MVLLIDNYDSFTYNLVQYLGELGAPPLRAPQRRGHARRGSRRCGRSASSSRPGPGRPEDAGITMDVDPRARADARRCSASASAIRRIGLAFGGSVVRAPVPMHGKTSTIEHDGRGVFRGVSQPFVAGRYHSLVVADPRARRSSRSARAHRGRHDHGRAPPHVPVHGVQFHPESMLTGEGPPAAAQFPGAVMFTRAASRSCSATRT